jgi:hypothetical protein
MGRNAAMGLIGRVMLMSALPLGREATESAMITKDFHRISGKSFVIMGRAEATAACPKCAVLLARPTGAKCAFGLALAGPNAHLAGVPSAGDWRLAIGDWRLAIGDWRLYREI